jgi:Domain of unknown function (DUF4249)
MKIYNIYLIGLTIIISALSCSELYFPKDLDSSAKIPVIHGIILENQVPTVTLSLAIGYNDTLPTYISGAQVLVSDNLGNSVQLEGTSPGTYSTMSNAVIGTQGRTYILLVKLPDGSEYSSNAVPLLKSPFIDSLYANPVSKTVYTYDTYNQPVPDQQEGLNILADLSGNGDSLLYYRFNTQVIQEMVYEVGSNTLGAHPVFNWSATTLDNSYSVDLTVTQDSREVLREHPIGFLRYFYDVSLETANSTAPITVGWILIFNVYSISADVYKYYNSIGLQLNSNNQMFAPIPSQVMSNIHCTSNPDKVVMGDFEASSVTTIYKAFGWFSLHGYYSRVLPSFPASIGGGSVINFPPAFWVSF